MDLLESVFTALPIPRSCGQCDQADLVEMTMGRSHTGLNWRVDPLADGFNIFEETSWGSLP